LTKKADFQITIDTREQKPYKFPNAITSKLDTGDYSIAGLESKIIIERKTKADAYGSLGNGRKRFENEFKRLAEIDYAAVIIECSLDNFLIQPMHSQLNPRSAINTLISWSIKYNVHIWFVDNRKLGQNLTYRILEKYFKNRRDDVK